MLKKEWVEIRAMEQLVEGLEEDIVKKIKETRDKNKEMIKAVEKMKKAGDIVLANKGHGNYNRYKMTK